MSTKTPLVDEATRAMKNLGTLRRLDPEIAEVLETAGHVCVYILDTNVMQWEHRNIEGSLFVVKRRSDPRFQILVLNRNSTENLVENILGESFAYELSKPYIMYTNDQPQTVHGIWFFDDQECDVISSLLTRILATYQPEPILTVPHQSQSATGGGRSEAYDTPSRNVSVGGNAASRNESNGTDIIAKFFNGVNVSRSNHTETTSATTRPVSTLPKADTSQTSTPILLTPAALAQKSSSLQSQSPPRQQAGHQVQRATSLSREQVRTLLNRLAANDEFCDIVKTELANIL